MATIKIITGGYIFSGLAYSYISTYRRLDNDMNEYYLKFNNMTRKIKIMDDTPGIFFEKCLDSTIMLIPNVMTYIILQINKK